MIALICEPTNFPLRNQERQKFTLFGASLLYNLWIKRNKIIYYGETPDLTKFVKENNTMFIEHFGTLKELENLFANAILKEGSSKKGNQNHTFAIVSPMKNFIDTAWKSGEACVARVTFREGKEMAS